MYFPIFQASFTAGELVDALCSDSLSQPADDFLANFNSLLREAVGIDCDTDWNTTYEIVSSLITLSKLANKVHVTEKCNRKCSTPGPLKLLKTQKTQT